MGDLEQNNIETQEMARTWTRLINKENSVRRDIKYVQGLLRLWASQAKEDRGEAKKNFREQKGRLERRAKEIGQHNRFKRPVKKMTEKYKCVYEKGRNKHAEKVQRLKDKHCPEHV